MPQHTIETSGLTLAKGAQLTGDDFWDVKAQESRTVAVLCDGVGSALQGAEAAQRTTQFLVDALRNKPASWSFEKSIRHFIQSINHILYTESLDDYGREELVTTLTLAIIEGNRLYGANVGDSRIYLLRDGQLTQLSHDHVTDPSDLDSPLEQAIGIHHSVTPYYFENLIRSGDQILLCSDGLYRELDVETLVTQMPLGGSMLVRTASRLHKDDLPDDTSALTLYIRDIDPRIQLKQAPLTVQEHYHKSDLIDGYRLLRPLAPNKRTWHVSKRGVDYVIKFAPVEVTEDDAHLDFFVQEAWNARRLKAGFFPKAVIPRHRTHRYYIMRYIDGTPLDQLIAKRPLSVDDGIALARFLLKMAQFLIRKNLIHGDIKPANILAIRRYDKLTFKMVDFGSITEAYSVASRAGTPSYLAPERFAKAPITEQSEIYAIGATLYESLTRSLPFGSIEPFQTPTFDATLRHPNQLNPTLPAWLDSVILHAVDPDPTKRYRNYSECVYDLDHPDTVKPYFDPSTSLVERKPLLLCKIGFMLMLIVNIFLLTK